MTSDPFSLLVFTSSGIETEQFKTTASLDYFNSGISGIALFDNYWGRLGLFIERSGLPLRDTLIKNVTGRDVVPTVIGVTAGKKINDLSFGLKLAGYRMEEYLTDQNSPYNNTNLGISDFSVNPSVSVNINEMLGVDVSVNGSILSASSDDVNRVIKTSSPMGYGVNGRVTQSFSENRIVIAAKYSHKPYGYEEMQQGEASGDVFVSSEETLSVRVLLAIESFSYVNTYLSAGFEQSVASDKTVFMTGSESEERVTESKFPEIAAGFSFYLNKFVSVNSGISGCWMNVKTENAPLLTPVLQVSGFEYDLRAGLLLSFDNLKIALDLSKEALDAPYFLSGNAINGLDMNIGISYTGYEF